MSDSTRKMHDAANDPKADGGRPGPDREKPSFIPLPPLIYAAGIILSLVLHAFYPLPWFGSPMLDILAAVGWLALLATAALFFTALRALRRARTPVNPNARPEHLVTAGPFGLSRNPLYLANTLLLIGLGLASGITWFLPLALICAYLIQKFSIEREERWLIEKFGKRYRDYAKRVRRWI